jgi:hypothetical protein
MGLHYKTTSAKSGKVVFQKVLETVRGGFTLETTGFSDGDIIPAGTPVEYNEDTRKAKVLRTARVYASSAGSPYQVEKNSNLAVGMNLGKTVGSAAYAITAIDTSNADYDVVTTGTTIGAVTEGDALFQSSASGASAAALSVTGAKGLLYDDVVYSKDATLSVVIRGTVYARRIAAPATVRSAMPLIVFSESR